MKLSPRDKLIATVVGVVIALIALVVLLVLPRFQAISEVRSQIAVAEQDSQAATALLQQRRAIRDEAAITDASLILLANAVPENPELPSLVIELQDAAYESEVMLRSVAPEPPVSGDAGALAIPITLTIYGTWDNTVDYLGELDELTRELRIVEFNTALLGHEEAVRSGLDSKINYYVRTVVTVEAYVIPGSGESTATAPVAPPAP